MNKETRILWWLPFELVSNTASIAFAGSVQRILSVISMDLPVMARRLHGSAVVRDVSLSGLHRFLGTLSRTIKRFRGRAYAKPPRWFEHIIVVGSSSTCSALKRRGIQLQFTSLNFLGDSCAEIRPNGKMEERYVRFFRLRTSLVA